MRILFICKKNSAYGFVNYSRRSSGLFYSTEFIAEALRKRCIHAAVVEVTDNNDIDREVARHQPDIVVVEALWVVPEKFPVLQKLHPSVKWFVHLHSHIPFLALEGVAMEWISRYAALGVGLIANSEECAVSLAQLQMCGKPLSVHVLKNVYGRQFHAPKSRECASPHEVLNVVCMGAIRPFKNQLLQAMAALKLARRRGQKLIFHMNTARVEGHGEPILRNLRALFDASRDAVLVEHEWLNPETLVTLLRRVDLGMQVSMTETFNIMAADYTAAGLPMVVSPEIPWASGFSRASVDDLDDIVGKAERALKWPSLVNQNQRRLRNYSKHSAQAWRNFVIAQK